MPTCARERLIETAERLFYRHGIVSVGVERLLAESGVGRASFYRHFDSKDTLVAAVLKARAVAWFETLTEAVAQQGDTPLAVFDVIAEHYAAQDFRGCLFINTMAETANRKAEAHRIAGRHKHALRDYFQMLIGKAGYPSSQQLAAQFLLLTDGAVTGAMREGDSHPVYEAQAIATTLLANAKR